MLKAKLQVLAHKLNKPIAMEEELHTKLLTTEGRHIIEMQLEDLGIAHLKVVECITDLYSEDILKKLLLS